MLITTPFEILDANIVSNNVVDNTAVWDPNFAYGLNTIVKVDAPNNHNLWKSVHSTTDTYPQGNKGFNPLLETDLDNPVHWSLHSATNRYKMFDKYASSQSESSVDMVFSVKDLGIVNTISLVNCFGSTARVVVTDTIDGVVYDKEQTLISLSGITSYYNYYFSPIKQKGFALFEDIPPYKDALITVTVTTQAGGKSKLGWFVGGYGYNFGSIKYGSEVRGKDYSIKEQLPTGEYYFAKGAFALEGSFEFDFKNGELDLLQNVLKEVRGAPALFVAYEEYESTLYYGIAFEPVIRLSYVAHSTCTLKLESLI